MGYFWILFWYIYFKISFHGNGVFHPHLRTHNSEVLRITKTHSKFLEAFQLQKMKILLCNINRNLNPESEFCLCQIIAKRRILFWKLKLIMRVKCVINFRQKMRTSLCRNPTNFWSIKRVNILLVLIKLINLKLL